MAAKSSQLALSVEQEQSSARSLRVLIDGRKLHHGGIGVYTDNLISGLARRSELRLTVLAAPNVARSFWWHTAVEIIEDNARPYSLDELLLLPRRIGMQRYDVFHTPHYILPYGLRIPSVVTVHDLIHIYYPEKPYYRWIGGALLRSTLKRATSVISVSESTRLEIARFTGHNRSVLDKVRVVPNAIDPFFLTAPVLPDYLWNRFRLSGNYFLAVVSLVKPHKGLADLLGAFGTVVKSMASIFTPGGREEPLKLIIVGQGAAHIREYPDLIRRAETMPGVHILGEVSQQDLLHLYSGSIGLVVPSLAEGFCLPVLEAHAVGTPVVARPVPAVVELSTERDVICRDFSVSALAEGMRKRLDAVTVGTPAMRERGGVDKLSRYDHEQLALAVASVYRQTTRAKGA